MKRKRQIVHELIKKTSPVAAEEWRYTGKVHPKTGHKGSEFE